jgi:hypothetical protein
MLHERPYWAWSRLAKLVGAQCLPENVTDVFKETTLPPRCDLAATVTVDVCSVLVLSCDAYADLWRPFFTLFWRYWPQCPFRVYLGANSTSYDDARVVSLRGGDREWSDRVIAHLRQIETPYVILMLEDFFLKRSVSTERILGLLEIARSRRANLVRLIPRPRPNSKCGAQGEVGQIAPGESWRVSTQAAIWSRHALLSLLRPGETIWQFEVNGTERSAASLQDGFYGVWKSVMPYDHHVVERGKWFRNEARRYRSEDIGCDFSARQVMTRREMLRWRFHKTSSGCFSWLPFPLQRFIISAVRTARSLGSSSPKRRPESGHR